MKSKSNYLRLAFAIVFILFVSLGTMNGCKNDSPPPSPSAPGPNDVWMQNTAFTPSSITVAVNTTVTWTNKDAMDHTVTSDSTGQFGSNNHIGGGGTIPSSLQGQVRSPIIATFMQA